MIRGDGLVVGFLFFHSFIFSSNILLHVLRSSSSLVRFRMCTEEKMVACKWVYIEENDKQGNIDNIILQQQIHELPCETSHSKSLGDFQLSAVCCY